MGSPRSGSSSANLGSITANAAVSRARSSFDHSRPAAVANARYSASATSVADFKRAARSNGLKRATNSSRAPSTARAVSIEASSISCAAATGAVPSKAASHAAIKTRARGAGARVVHGRHRKRDSARRQSNARSPVPRTISGEHSRTNAQGWRALEPSAALTSFMTPATNSATPSISIFKSNKPTTWIFCVKGTPAMRSA